MPGGKKSLLRDTVGKGPFVSENRRIDLFDVITAGWYRIDSFRIGDVQKYSFIKTPLSNIAITCHFAINFVVA